MPTNTFKIHDWVRPTSVEAFSWYSPALFGLDGHKPGALAEPQAYEVIAVEGTWVICVRFRLGAEPCSTAPLVLRSSHCELALRPPFTAGALVYLTRTPTIDPTNSPGYMGAKHFLVRGSSAVVVSTDMKGAYVKFHADSYAPDQKVFPGKAKVFSTAPPEDGIDHHRGLYRFSYEDLSTTAPLPAVTKEGKTMGSSYRLSFFALKQGMNRPATYLLQHVLNRLAEVKEQPSWKVTADGGFGTATAEVVKAVQAAYQLSADGVIGKDTWRTLTPDLGDFFTPLYLRIAECQCTWESGKHGFEYWGIIPQEGWPNFGVWNVNKESLQALLSCFGQQNLYPLRDSDPQTVANACGSKAGREAQVGNYFLKYLLKPSLANLAKIGFSADVLGVPEEITAISDLPNRLEPFYERLLTLAVDITVNAGAGGFFPMKTPRAWSGSGDMVWPERLPAKEEVKRVYGEVFGRPISDDFTYLTSGTRDTYKVALKRCLDELCADDEQRLALIAELQGRCTIDTWRAEVTRRRRACAWADGCTFQGSFYCLSEHFGIGI